LAVFLLYALTMEHLAIEAFMTPSPHTIGRAQPVALALKLMSEHRVRHLPVLDGGSLVGMVSERDLQFIETLRDVDVSKIAVEEAITTEAFTVAPGTPLRTVAEQMAEHKYGSAVVMDKERVVGVFTTIDALRALSSLLEKGARVGG
jgi:acetoin utilization protein AcuB